MYHCELKIFQELKLYMTFPNTPPEGINPIQGLDSNQVALLLLVSIAFEELGLAHLINTEAEKLQGAIGTLVKENGQQVNPNIQARSLAELLAANREVEKVLRTIIKKEMLLEFKFENILEFLSTTTSTTTTTSTSTTTTTTTTSTTSTSTTTTSPCGCSLTPVVNTRISGMNIVQPTVPSSIPPINTQPTGASILDIVIDICSGCTPDNAFTWDYQRTPGSQFRQQFVANSFNVTCLVNEDGIFVGMIISGTGVATGEQGGFTTPAGSQTNYLLVLDDNLNTATLTLLNGLVPVFVHGPQTINVEFDVTSCP